MPQQPFFRGAGTPRNHLLAALIAILLASASADLPAQAPAASSAEHRWLHGPAADPAFFPLAVWLQAPANAERYRRAGFNLYVGLWKGPTEEQLTALNQAGMKVICEQNAVSLAHLDDATIVGWIHGDEPDNAQSLGARLGWGAPVKPEKVIEEYRRMRLADASRPVLLNLGQGVAWDGWYGRGVRNHHPEDYPEYLKGCDIVSFDIYPVVHPSAEVAGNLWFVAQGVTRLVQWSAGRQLVWNAVECTRIDNPSRKPTPSQVRAEVWMSLIHGSRGLIYFVHQFKPVFREAALLDDAEMLDAVTALNRQITELAPVLNSPTVTDGVAVHTEDSAVPVAAMLKRREGARYLFAVAMRNASTSATFKLQDVPGDNSVEVLGEHRTLAAHDGQFSDRFLPWAAHLYRMTPRR
jgi:hypothetical protein